MSPPASLAGCRTWDDVRARLTAYFVAVYEDVARESAARMVADDRPLDEIETYLALTRFPDIERTVNEALAALREAGVSVPE